MRSFGFTLLACLLGVVSWSGVSFGANSSSDVISSEDSLEQFEWVLYSLEDYDIHAQSELVDWEKLSEQEVELVVNGCFLMIFPPNGGTLLVTHLYCSPA